MTPAARRELHAYCVQRAQVRLSREPIAKRPPLPTEELVRGIAVVALCLLFFAVVL